MPFINLVGGEQHTLEQQLIRVRRAETTVPFHLANGKGAPASNAEALRTGKKAVHNTEGSARSPEGIPRTTIMNMQHGMTNDNRSARHDKQQVRPDQSLQP